VSLEFHLAIEVWFPLTIIWVIGDVRKRHSAKIASLHQLKSHVRHQHFSAVQYVEMDFFQILNIILSMALSEMANLTFLLAKAARTHNETLQLNRKWMSKQWVFRHTVHKGCIWLGAMKSAFCYLVLYCCCVCHFSMLGTDRMCTVGCGGGTKQRAEDAGVSGRQRGAFRHNTDGPQQRPCPCPPTVAGNEMSHASLGAVTLSVYN